LLAAWRGKKGGGDREYRGDISPHWKNISRNEEKSGQHGTNKGLTSDGRRTKRLDKTGKSTAASGRGARKRRRNNTISSPLPIVEGGREPGTSI